MVLTFAQETVLETLASSAVRDKLIINRIVAEQASRRLVESPTIVGVTVARWRGHTGVKRSQWKVTRETPRSRGATGVSKPVEARGYSHVPYYSGEYYRRRAVYVPSQEKEVVTKARVSLSVSERTERRRKLVSWGDRYKAGTEFGTYLPAVEPITNKEARHLAHRMKLLETRSRKKRQLDDQKEWLSMRALMSSGEKVLMDRVLADPESISKLKTSFGVLQGALQSQPQYDSDNELEFPDFGPKYQSPVQSAWTALATLLGIYPTAQHYHFFLLGIDFLTVTSIPQAFLKLEILNSYASHAGVHNPYSAGLVQMGICLAQLGLGVASVFQAEDDSFITKLLEVRDSPLSIKLASAFLAVIPAISSVEMGTMGKSVVGSALDHLRTTATPHATALSALAEVADLMHRNIIRYSETGDMRDLLGRESNQAWILDANQAMQTLNDLRDNFKGKDVRGALREAEALYEKGLKSKHPQVMAKVRELEIRIKSFKSGLSRHRKPPVAMILVGPPGCGKTVFLETLERVVKNRFDIQDRDVTIMYDYSATNFQNPPSILSILTLNDYFQLKAESPKLKGDPLDILQKFADSSPLDVEGASLELKNLYLQPDFVVVTTNSYNYQFSNSVGGISKLDRRYLVVEFSWTPEFLQEAIRKNVEPYLLFREGGFESRFAVVYRLGHMKNSTDASNQVINFTPRAIIMETTNIAQVLGFLLKEESKREDIHRRRFGAGFAGPLCKCGLPHGSGCPCEPRAADEEDFWADPHQWMGYGHYEEYQGAKVSHSVEAGSLETLVGISETLRDAMAHIPGGHNGGTLDRFDETVSKTIDKIKAAIPTDFQVGHYFTLSIPDFSAKNLLIFALGIGAVAITLKALAQRFETQGVVSSTMSFPKPGPELHPLPPFHATQAPYLNPRSAANVVDIERARVVGNTVQRVFLHAIILTKFWLVLPHHFFTSFNGCPAAEDGDLLKITYLGQPFEMIFYKRFLYRPTGEGERAYLYNPCMHSVSAGVFNLLPEEFECPTEKVRLGAFDQLTASIRSGKLSYVADTLAGSCGQPLIGETTGCVYGMHYSRTFDMFSSGYCLAEPLCKKEARLVFDWGNKNSLVSEVITHNLPAVLQGHVSEGRILPGLHPKSDASFYAREKGDEWPLHNHQVIGHYASCDKERFSVHKTSLFDHFGSRCQEYGNPWSGKARLQDDGSWKSAVTMRFDAAKNPKHEWNMDLCEQVVKAMLDELDIPKSRPLTDYESMCGSDVDVMINPKDKTKSLGPSAQAANIRKEDAFIDTGEGEHVVHPTLLEWIANLHAELEGDGPLDPCYVKAQGKDEAYPTAKAAKGRKRFFYLSDWHLNHVSRTLLLPLISILVRQPTKSGVFITINASSPAWGTFADWLQEMGFSIMDADFSSFDLCHRFILLMYILFMTHLAERAGYTPASVRKTRRLLIKRLFYALHMEGNLFWVLFQLCSGWVDTIIVNCFVVKFLFYYTYFWRCWQLKVIPKTPRTVMHVAAVGDDSAVNVHPSIHHIITPEIAQMVAKGLGYGMTAGNKSAKMEFVRLEDIVFLKRKFKREGPRVWAPLDLDSIYKSLSYCTGKQKGDEQVFRDMSAVQSASREMFLHGRLVYDSFLVEISNIFPSMRFNSYDELLLEYDNHMFETWRNTKSMGVAFTPMNFAQLPGVEQLQAGVLYRDVDFMVLFRVFAVPLLGEMMRRGPCGWFYAIAQGAVMSEHHEFPVVFALVHFGLICWALPWWLSFPAQVVHALYVESAGRRLGQHSPVICESLSFVLRLALAMAELGELLWYEFNYYFANLPVEALKTVPYLVSVLNIGFYAPLAEEVVKRSTLGLLLPFIEFVSYSTICPWQVRFVPLVFHISVLLVPWEVAVGAHFAWNMMSLDMAGLLPESVGKWVRLVTAPLSMVYEVLTNSLLKICPPEVGGGVVYPPAHGAMSVSPTPSRGAFKDFPVPKTSHPTRAYALRASMCSTELNSQPITLTDETSALTHITSIAGDTVVESGGIVPTNGVPEQDYKNFFARPRQVRTILSTTTFGYWGSLVSEWSALAPVADMARQWGLFRGKPKVTISYTGSSSLIGLYRVFFYPAAPMAYSPYNLANYPTLGASHFNLTSTSNLPHVDLDMSAACTCSIDLPYISNRPMTEWEADWNYGFIALNANKTASGVTPTPVTISIFVSYEDVQLSRVEYQSGGEVSSRIVSRGMALAESISRWVPIMTPYTKLLELGGKAAYELGYSRAIEPVTASVRAKKYGNLGYLTGEASFAELLGSDPLMCRDMGRKHLAGVEEDSISAIAGKWSMVHTDFAGGSSIPIEPLFYGWGDGTGVSFSNMGQMALMFERWSGSISIRVQVVSSPLVRTRYGFVVVQPGTPLPTVWPGEGIYETHIVEAVGSVDYEFNVPFVDRSPYRLCVPRALIGTPADSSTFAQLLVFQLSPIQGPSATSVSPVINIWMKAGPDFSLSVPSLGLLSTYTQYQSGNVVVEIESSGEKVDSLRTLSKRKSAMCRVTPVNLNYNHFSFPADGMLPGPNTTYNNSTVRQYTVSERYYTFDTYIRSLFWGYTGGTAYTLWRKPTDPWVIGTGFFPVGEPPTDNSRARTLGRGAAMYFPDENKVMEIVAPDRAGYMYKKSIWTMPASNASLTGTENLSGVPMERGMTTTLEPWVLMSGSGDDRMYVLYLGALRTNFGS